MRKLSDKQLLSIVNKAIDEFGGNSQELKGAIGTLFIGQHYGWKVMVLIHDKKTIRKYEEILGVSFREVMPELGEMSERSFAWKAASKLGNFWKAVKGEYKGIRTPEVAAK